jgi:hypothetical protein
MRDCTNWGAEPKDNLFFERRFLCTIKIVIFKERNYLDPRRRWRRGVETFRVCGVITGEVG